MKHFDSIPLLDHVKGTNNKCKVRKGRFSCRHKSILLLWNQGFVNISFDDNKTRFEIDDYISSMIRQKNFQNDNHKDKIKLKKN